MPASEPAPAPEQKAEAKQGESFSLFVTRILDQLSPSSWLPAIMLVCNLALILQLRSQRNLDIGRAVTDLTAKPLGILIVLLLSIVVASVVTQAFEFEVIRLLEGYWGSTRLLRSLSSVRTNRHVRRLRRLRERYDHQLDVAFSKARREMEYRRVDRDTINILTDEYYGRPLNSYPADHVAEALRLGWRTFAHPEFLRRANTIESQILSYPDFHRVLPTRLGNTLRSTEDRLRRESDEDLENFVYRRYELMDPRLTLQHDQFRSRLNICCLLTFIFAGLALVSPLLLTHQRADIVGALIFTVVYAVLAALSYQAAIASARGYVRFSG